MLKTVLVHAVGRELPPLEMPDRFRHEITYFMTPGGEQGVPVLARGEYWIRSEDARRIYDEGIVELVSPLDTENKAEVELSEEHERWLEWMLRHAIEHVRLV